MDEHLLRISTDSWVSACPYKRHHCWKICHAQNSVGQLHTLLGWSFGKGRLTIYGWEKLVITKLPHALGKTLHF